MTSLAVASRGVPIPVEEIHSVLRSVAVPGYTGVLQLDLWVRPEAAAYVMLGVTRRQSKSMRDEAGPTREEIPAVGEHLRKKSVQRAVDGLREKLVLRTVLLAVEAHYVDGELKKVTIVE
jgi:hypothetical protein